MMGAMPSETDLSALAHTYAGVRTRVSGGNAVLAPWGEVDHGSVPYLYGALSGLAAETESVVLDMAAVTFMDTAGLYFLECLRDYGRQHRIPVETVNWTHQPRRMLTTARGVVPVPLPDAERP